jgi:catechol 2,3-dioxygenase-like lactoylglutathione lyase family enzyme
MRERSAPVSITGFDHLVLTVTDLDETVVLYERALGMTCVTFAEGRRALEFGQNKINLHLAGQEFLPHARQPAPGSADFCLVTATPVHEVIAHLAAEGITVEDGPVPRTGAAGPITSVYIRDPDGNLVEIASYDGVLPARVRPCTGNDLARRNPANEVIMVRWASRKRGSGRSGIATALRSSG